MFVPGYRLRNGSPLDRPQLVKFARRTYRELYPDQDFAHLPRLIEQYLSAKTPLWWVEAQHDDEGGFPHRRRPLGCLWLGNAVDQIDGDRHAHIFLLYVDPDHRRRGIGSALVHHAETWARRRGDRQLGLQVFAENQRAIHLYEKLGYRTFSHWMVKPLD
ncbi:GNAT family N-acetyltransferase [Phormidium yuhuli AB48]|uniref:GNAT family N-acetyltransferase n=1 Tax=Phormidium yuhuli AB48 TaxID=2940671 RepID=A0ABY5AW85_9CYAN|nr:GNAT family N-acetyltransferase [Phormidium yuhuli]USR92469.1 GNAT family N-acetyltransferase [Phormidium yuhuli AB48]